MSRQWTINIPATVWLTANKERHFYSRSAVVRTWRQQTVMACERADLPTGVSPVRLHAVAYHLSSHAPVRDRLNLSPTIKAIVDGLTPEKVKMRGGRKVVSAGYGLLPDDSDKHVLDTTWDVVRLPVGNLTRFGLPGEVGVVVLTITEASA